MSSWAAADERVLWEGAPPRGLRFTVQDIFAIPFSVFWTGMVTLICLLGATGAATNIDPMAYVILPIFLLVGLYMMVGRFLVDVAGRRRTRYLLTDRRAVIESGIFRSNQRSVSLAASPEIRLRRERNGRGTILFGSSMFGMLPSSWPGAGQFLPPSFEGIEDAERIYDLALRAQHDAQSGR